MAFGDEDFNLGLLGLFNPNLAGRIAAEREAAWRRQYDALRATTPEPWDETATKYKDLLYLSAETWRPVRLFDAKPLREPPGTRVKITKANKKCVFSPDGRWVYMNPVVPAGDRLSIYMSNKRIGKVCFDADVICPNLCEMRDFDNGRPKVWMSYTPMEIMSQRFGVQLAKGRVVIGGLGLGWFLNAVCSKKSVTEVVLVEREKVLLDWLYPRIEAAYPAVAAKGVTVVNDDVWTYMDGDAANHATTKYLLDIWDSYNTYDHKLEKYKTKLGRGRVWGWGCYAN